MNKLNMTETNTYMILAFCCGFAMDNAETQLTHGLLLAAFAGNLLAACISLCQEVKEKW